MPVDVVGWRDFRKTRVTRALRMEGPFECVTVDGNVARCEDGWLLIDAHGHPYPCEAADFAASYVPVERDTDDLTGLAEALRSVPAAEPERPLTGGLITDACPRCGWSRVS